MRYGISDSAAVEEVSLSPAEYLSMASGAKLIAAMATYPHEVVRTRMREQRGLLPGQVHKYTGKPLTGAFD